MGDMKITPKSSPLVVSADLVSQLLVSLFPRLFNILYQSAYLPQVLHNDGVSSSDYILSNGRVKSE